MELFPGALQTEQKIGGWREALENEMNLKDSEAYHRPTGSKYLVVRAPHHIAIVNTLRTWW